MTWYKSVQKRTSVSADSPAPSEPPPQPRPRRHGCAESASTLSNVPKGSATDAGTGNARRQRLPRHLLRHRRMQLDEVSKDHKW